MIFTLKAFTVEYECDPHVASISKEIQEETLIVTFGEENYVIGKIQCYRLLPRGFFFSLLKCKFSSCRCEEDSVDRVQAKLVPCVVLRWCKCVLYYVYVVYVCLGVENEAYQSNLVPTISSGITGHHEYCRKPLPPSLPLLQVFRYNVLPHNFANNAPQAAALLPDAPLGPEIYRLSWMEAKTGRPAYVSHESKGPLIYPGLFTRPLQLEFHLSLWLGSLKIESTVGEGRRRPVSLISRIYLKAKDPSQPNLRPSFLLCQERGHACLSKRPPFPISISPYPASPTLIIKAQNSFWCNNRELGVGGPKLARVSEGRDTCVHALYDSILCPAVDISTTAAASLSPSLPPTTTTTTTPSPPLPTPECEGVVVG